MKRKEAVVATPIAQRMIEFKERRIPIIVWLIAVAGSTVLLGGHRNRADLVGLAKAPTFDLSAPATGRVAEILVDLYDAVEEGQALVHIDDTEIGARLERSRATIRQLTAELESERTATGSDRASDLRRFQVDEEQRRLEQLELRATMEADEIELRRLELDRARAASLFADGLLSEAENDRAQLEHAEASRRLESNEQLLFEVTAKYNAALDRRRGFERGRPSPTPGDTSLDHLREAINVERHRLEEIRQRREALTLRSPVAGHVSDLRSSRGRTIVRGTPVLTVTGNSVQEIVAYVAESNGRTLGAETPVRVSSATNPGLSFETKILRFGRSLEALPRRLWPNPEVEAFGRAVVIAARPGSDLIHDELVRVELIGGR